MITGRQATVACLGFLGVLWGATFVVGRNTASALAEGARSGSVSSPSGVGQLYAGSMGASAPAMGARGGAPVEKIPSVPEKLLGGVDDKGGSPPGCTTYKFAVRRDTTYYEVLCVKTTLPWSK